jgi:nicotinamide-nucleotide amidase
MLLDPKDHPRILKLLKGWGGQFCCAESLTCGNVQRAVGEISGISEYLAGGITCYTIDCKARLLGVNRDEAEAMNAVSPAIARQMAAGAMRMFGAEMAMATTGYAEPDPERKVEVPMGYYVCIVLVDGQPRVMDGVWKGKANMSRTEAQEAMAKAVVKDGFAFLESLVG